MKILANMPSYSSSMQKLGKDVPRIKPNRKFGFHCRMPVSAKELVCQCGEPLYGWASVAGEARGCNEYEEANPWPIKFCVEDEASLIRLPDGV